MIYDKIVSAVVPSSGPFDTGNLLVWYGVKDSNKGRVPSINYVANINGSKINGEFGGGTAWDTIWVDSSTANNLVLKTETIYVGKELTGKKNLTLPASPSDKAEIIVRFSSQNAGKIIVNKSGSVDNIFASWDSITGVGSVTVDKNTPQVHFYYNSSASSWYVTYSGLTTYNDITPYWKNKYSTTTVTSALPDTRYIVAQSGITINLPRATYVNNGYKVSVNTELLSGAGQMTVKPTTDPIIYKGREVTTLPLSRATKQVQFIKTNNMNKYIALTNEEQYWVDSIVSSNVSGMNRFRYICTTGLSCTLPKTPNENDKIAIYVEKLGNTATTSSVCVRSTDKTICLGTTNINTSDYKGLQIDFPLVGCEFVYFDSKWHVMNVTVPSDTNGNEYFGDEVTIHLNDQTNVFSVKPAANNVTKVLKSVNGTVSWQNQAGGNISIDGTTIVYDTTNNYYKVADISNTINCGPQVYLSKSNSGGVTTITCNIPVPPSGAGTTDKTYVLTCRNGVLSWVETATC